MTHASHRLALMTADLERGGAQRSMVTLANAFSERGHQVDLLVASDRGPLREDLRDAVRVVPLAGSLGRLPGVAGTKRRRVLAAVPALVGYLRRERPAALMPTSHSVCVAGMLGLGLARAPVRSVLRIDSALSRSPDLAGTRTQRRRMRRAQRFFPRADRIIGISEGLAHEIRSVLGLPRQRVVAIHNPVLTARVRAKLGEPLEDPWFAAGAPPVVLGVGRFTAQKDFPTLLRAFARVRAARPARLLILGEGRERAALEALAASLGIGDDLRLPGFAENPLPYMARASVFVLSSAWEGFGNVLVEALACGTPVVSTDCPSGPAEILDGGRHGALAPVGDAAALADAIARTLDRPLDADALRKRAEDFSAEAVADRYLDVLLGAPA